MFFVRKFCSASTSLLKKEVYQGNSVVRFILNDEKRRNALSLQMIEELHAELQGINKIKKLRSIIIASEGKVFSSGHDLNELKTDKGVDMHSQVFDKCSQLIQFIQSMQVPVIAEVSGVAAAAGCQLVASCDIVVAAKSSKFLVPGQKVGIFCSTPGVALSRAVPSKVALDMLMTGRSLTSDEAQAFGLVSRVVPDEEVRLEALKVAEQIGEYSRSVTNLGKSFFYMQSQLNTAEAYRYGGKVMVANLKLQDAQEGISAFIDKRTPEYIHTNEPVQQ
ncbi:unnamed protein product [Auanema sp. JU1783]|nr:unnamed protein product [Auanema sp. JU1783]